MCYIALCCAVLCYDKTVCHCTPLLLSMYVNTLCVCRVFGTVSYYVQKLFSQYQGVRYIDTEVSSSDADLGDHGIAASASCQDEACTKIAFKVSQSLCCAVVSCVNAAAWYVAVLRTVPCCATHCAMLCYAVLCCAVLCHAMLCYVMLCYAELCCAMLCCAVLCYAMLRLLLQCAVLCSVVFLLS